jgi:hypothetical protein
MPNSCRSWSGVYTDRVLKFAVVVADAGLTGNAGWFLDYRSPVIQQIHALCVSHLIQSAAGRVWWEFVSPRGKPQNSVASKTNFTSKRRDSLQKTSPLL